LKGTYNAAWSDPNPQINTQGISRTFTPQTDVYNRYWTRTTRFTYSSPGTKRIYWKGSGPNGTQYPNFFSIHWWNSRELGFAGQILADCGYGSCNLYPNMASKPLADNVWYCVEEHVKLNTPSVADGMIEVWVDGTQTLGYYNRTFRGTEPNGTNGNSSGFQFNTQEIYKQNGDGVMYYDQFTAGNTRIGCLGTTPPTDTQTPSVPTNLTVS
jgi:hypothetical protein